MRWGTRYAGEKQTSTTSLGYCTIPDNTNKSAKDLAAIIVGGKAWESLRKV